MSSRYAKIERTLGRIFIVILASILTVVSFEFFYRALNKQVGFFDFTRQTIDSNHVQKPYVMFTAKPDPKAGINSLGYKGSLPSLTKPKNEFRVFFIGGSVLYFGPHNFLDILQSRVPQNIKFFNLGIPSSASRQELIRVLLDVAGYQPDLIVSFSGYNDLYDTGWDPRVNYPHRYVLYEANPALKSAEDYELLPALALKSKFLRDHYSKLLVGLLVRDVIPQKLPQRDSIRQVIADAYMQNLRLTNVVAKHLGADFISFFQPVLFFKECLTEQEQLALKGFPLQRAVAAKSAVAKAYEQHKSEFLFYDLSELFKGDCKPAFIDYVHLAKSYAQEKVANHIFPILNKAILSKAKIKSRKHVSPRPLYIPEEVFTPQ